MNNIPVYFLNALLIAAVVLLGCSWIFARWWCKPTRQTTTKTPTNYGLAGSLTHLNNRGVRLTGWFIPGKTGSEPWPAVLMMHGWSRSSSELLAIAKILNEAGFAILLFDARGHGRSGEDGPITIKKFAEDIRAGMDYLATRKDVDGQSLGVFGRSLGGSAALLAAAQDPRVHALMSCSAFADPRALTRDTLKMMHIPTWPFTGLVCAFIEHWLGTAMDNVTPVNQIHRITAPILLVHGEADRYIGSHNLDILFSKASPDRTKKILVPGRGHSDIIQDQHVRQASVEFFRRHLLQVHHESLEGRHSSPVN